MWGYMRFHTLLVRSAAIFALCLGFLTTAEAQTIVQGRIEASSPCELSPARESDFIGCAQVMVPIEARLVATSTKGTRFVIKSDRNGEFIRTLPRGRYSVRLARASVGGKIVPAPTRDLKLSRTSFTVRRKPSFVDFTVTYDPMVSVLVF